MQKGCPEQNQENISSVPGCFRTQESLFITKDIFYILYGLLSVLFDYREQTFGRIFKKYERFIQLGAYLTVESKKCCRRFLPSVYWH